MLESFLVGAAASGVMGVVLWLLLPRGIILTRTFAPVDSKNRRKLDTWSLRNESSLPIRVARAEYRGADTYSNGSLAWIRLNPADMVSDRFELQLDSDLSGGEVLAGFDKWRQFTLPPGDALLVRMPNNSQLRVRYRRAGLGGIVERRSIEIHGVA